MQSFAEAQAIAPDILFNEASVLILRGILVR